MAYTMSSFFTTGGIRGGKEIAGKFQLRSFNMGISRSVFEKTGGFRFDRYAEDIEFSIRMNNMGFTTALIPNAFVYHKRRSTWKQFFGQVFNFGRGRVQVARVHPGQIKITHWFPSFFLLGIFLTPFILVIDARLSLLFLSLYFLYFFGVALDTLVKSRSLFIAILSIPSAFIQLTGYGLGFLKEKFFRA
jgi:GT2 family glycosyltransferase